jgi:hypothetical protein
MVWCWSKEGKEEGSLRSGDRHRNTFYNTITVSFLHHNHDFLTPQA